VLSRDIAIVPSWYQPSVKNKEPRKRPKIFRLQHSILRSLYTVIRSWIKQMFNGHTKYYKLILNCWWVISKWSYGFTFLWCTLFMSNWYQEDVRPKILQCFGKMPHLFIGCFAVFQFTYGTRYFTNMFLFLNSTVCAQWIHFVTDALKMDGDEVMVDIYESVQDELRMKNKQLFKERQKVYYYYHYLSLSLLLLLLLNGW